MLKDQERLEKIRRQRELKQLRVLEPCTFAPAIS
jgi:hypothetical protein